MIRSRGANGGLLVLGTLLRFWRAPNGHERPSLGEVATRASYLASLSASALALLLILTYPFHPRLFSWAGAAVAVPYFIAISTDLRRCGYHRRDVFGLYVFNLVLLPVNLAGAFSSLVQGVGGHTVSFARTPKVRGRTITQPSFIIVPIVLLAWTLYSMIREVHDGSLSRAVFVALNAVGFAYGFAAYIGIRAAAVDLVLGVRAFVTVPVSAPSAAPPDLSWRAVLGLSLRDEVAG